MTDQDVIAAIRRNHLQANISCRAYVKHHWDRAWLDPGGTIFGEGPYVKLPVDWRIGDSNAIEEVVIRVYAPARLRRRLHRLWTRALGAAPRCSCEVDRHDFNCPVHNDVDHPKRGPNGDE